MILLTEVNKSYSQYKTSEFWHYFNLMYFHVPTFSEFDMPLVVIFRFTRYSMGAGPYISGPFTLRTVSPNLKILHWLHIFQAYLHNHERELIFTIQTQILLHNPATSRFNEIQQPQKCRTYRSLHVIFEIHHTIMYSWKSSLKLLK